MEQTKETNTFATISCLHYYGVIFFFILGAGCGALVTQHFGSTTIVYCNILLLLTCALLSIEHVEE